MLKKALILIAIFIIILLIISRCGDDSPEPQVSFDEVSGGLGNAADNLGNKVGGLADSAKDAAGKVGSAAGDLAGSAKDVAGNTLDAAGNMIGKAGTVAGDIADSAKDAAGNTLDAAGNVIGKTGTVAGDLADSAKDAAGNTLDAAGNVIGKAGTAAGDLAGSAKDAARNTLDAANKRGTSLSTITNGSNINLQGVTFKFNSSELESSSYAILDGAAKKLDAMNGMVEVAGYTDNKGSDAINREISKSRAEAVLNYLSSKIIDSGRLSAKGYGSDSPVADNSTQKGRRANRRVELHVQ
jgi:outer membrane protein OmpA-like peptidoglycan-associated protein